MFTGSNKELLRIISYLKFELEILRAKAPDRITFKPVERRCLVRAGKQLGSVLRQVVTIVFPETLLRQFRAGKKGAKKLPPKKLGRRRTDEQIQELILKFARENDWGYPRIVGELKKLGIHRTSKSTVKRILEENGIEPCPNRGRGVWNEFRKVNAETLWQCDFLSRKIVTLDGICYAFALVFIYIKTRHVNLAPATHNPNDHWVARQTEAFIQTLSTRGLDVQWV